MNKEQIAKWLEKHGWLKGASYCTYKKGNRMAVLTNSFIQVNGTGTRVVIFYDEAELQDYGIVAKHAPVIILA